MARCAWMLRSPKITILLIFFANSASAQSDPTTIYTTCMATYAHYARVALMSGNAGLAREALFRASRNSAAWMLAVAQNETITAQHQQDAANVGQVMNSMFNSDQSMLSNYIGFCERESETAIQIFSRSSNTIWGLTFDELQDEVFNEYLQELSIR